MSVNLGLAQVSGDFLIAALVIYSLAVLAFAGDFAFGRPRRAAARATGLDVGAGRAAGAVELAAVGAGSAAVAKGAAAKGGAAVAEGAAATGGTAVAGDDAGAGAAGGTGAAAGTGGGAGAAGGSGGVLHARQGSAFRAIWQAGPWVRVAVTLSAVGILAHLVAVVTRGFAVHRAPWGNMYEFVTALTCVAAIFFCYVLVRYRAWALGVFVMGSVVLALGLAETVIYTAAGPLGCLPCSRTG